MMESATWTSTSFMHALDMKRQLQGGVQARQLQLTTDSTVPIFMTC